MLADDDDAIIVQENWLRGFYFLFILFLSRRAALEKNELMKPITSKMTFVVAREPLASEYFFIAVLFEVYFSDNHVVVWKADESKFIDIFFLFLICFDRRIEGRIFKRRNRAVVLQVEGEEGDEKLRKHYTNPPRKNIKESRPVRGTHLAR